VTNGHINEQAQSNGVEAKSEQAKANGHANGNGIEAKKVESPTSAKPVVGFRYNEYDGKV
jgi:hypothetical protein